MGRNGAVLMLGGANVGSGDGVNNVIDDFSDGVIGSEWSVLLNYTSIGNWTESGGTANFVGLTLDATGINVRNRTTHSYANGVDFDISVKSTGFLYFEHVGGPVDGAGLSLDQFNTDNLSASSLVQGPNGVDIMLAEASAQTRVIVHKRVANTVTTLGSVDITNGTSEAWFRLARVGTTLTAYYKLTEAAAWTTIGSYDISAITQTMKLCLAILRNNAISNAGNPQVKFDDLSNV